MINLLSSLNRFLNSNCGGLFSQTKKRYVGYKYESANQTSPIYEAKGIETVRRDGCPAVVKVSPDLTTAIGSQFRSRCRLNGSDSGTVVAVAVRGLRRQPGEGLCPAPVLQDPAESCQHSGLHLCQRVPRPPRLQARSRRSWSRAFKVLKRNYFQLWFYVRTVLRLTRTCLSPRFLISVYDLISSCSKF